MFEFLFRRAQPRTADTPAPDKVRGAKVRDAQGRTSQERSSQPADMARLRAENLVRDVFDSSDAGAEQALVDFLLSCPHAEARLIAAAGVQTRPMLARVRDAMRNTDRRVTKLVQARLDQLARADASAARAKACIARASALLEQTAPCANQLAELDRAWSEAGEPPALLAYRFDVLRARLAADLRAQTELQRALLDTAAGLRALARDCAGLAVDDAAERFGALDAALNVHLGGADAAALPQSVAADAVRARELCVAALDAARRSRTALDARAALLAGWEAATKAARDVRAMRAAWAACGEPGASEEASRQQERFAALTDAVRPAAPAARPSAKLAVDASAAIEALAAALAEGKLKDAARHERELRERTGLPPAQAQRLQELRAELARLNDWARWGGNVSREELAASALALPAQDLAPEELGRRINDLRARWKALDAQSGPAPKALWERFDAACTAAYAPVAAHRQAQAEQRSAGAAQARALVAEVAAYAGAPDDWKALAAFVQQAESRWRQLGPVDRKDRKALDAEFDKALQALRTPLAARRKDEAAQRERWIAEAEALDAGSRGTGERIKQLQQAWQDSARAVPLARKEEQALWQRFRAACDSVYARARGVHAEADARRQASLAQAQALCERLEQAAAQPADEGRALLRDARAQWRALDELPRASIDAMAKRFDKAADALERALLDARRARVLAQEQAALDRLAACQALEAALARGDAVDADAWRTRWSALPASGHDAALGPRFEAALAVLDDAAARARRVALLEANRAALREHVLRLEIHAGVDSPQALQAERLKLQVQVLRDALRSGQDGAQAQALLKEIYALPAVSDDDTGHRLARAAAGLQSRAGA